MNSGFSRSPTPLPPLPRIVVLVGHPRTGTFSCRSGESVVPRYVWRFCRTCCGPARGLSCVARREPQVSKCAVSSSFSLVARTSRWVLTRAGTIQFRSGLSQIFSSGVAVWAVAQIYGCSHDLFDAMLLTRSRVFAGDCWPLVEPHNGKKPAQTHRFQYRFSKGATRSW